MDLSSLPDDQLVSACMFGMMTGEVDPMQSLAALLQRTEANADRIEAETGQRPPRSLFAPGRADRARQDKPKPKPAANASSSSSGKAKTSANSAANNQSKDQSRRDPKGKQLPKNEVMAISDPDIVPHNKRTLKIKVSSIRDLIRTDKGRMTLQIIYNHQRYVLESIRMHELKNLDRFPAAHFMLPINLEDPECGDAFFSSREQIHLTLLGHCDCVHGLERMNPNSAYVKYANCGHREVMAVATIDPRKAFAANPIPNDPVCPMTVLMKEPYDEFNFTRIGTLSLRLSLDPGLSSSCDLTKAGELIKQQEKEEKASMDRFVEHAGPWLENFYLIGPDFHERHVYVAGKLEGQLRPLFTCLRPIPPGKAVETPFHALRLVNIMFTDDELETSMPAKLDKLARIDRDSPTLHLLSPASIIGRRGGTDLDRAFFLASLLLGFGLPAYVALGEDKRGTALKAWVAVLEEGDSATFYDPFQGCRWHVPTCDPRMPFETLDCLIGQDNIYANAQPSNFITHCSFNLSKKRNWVSLKTRVSKACQRSFAKPAAAALIPANKPNPQFARQLEKEALQNLVQIQKSTFGINTRVYEGLSEGLGPVLEAMIHDRLYGLEYTHHESLAALQSQCSEGGLELNLRLAHLRGTKVPKAISEAVHSFLPDMRSAANAFGIRMEQANFPEGLAEFILALGMVSKK